MVNKFRPVNSVFRDFKEHLQVVIKSDNILLTTLSDKSKRRERLTYKQITFAQKQLSFRAHSTLDTNFVNDGCA